MTSFQFDQCFDDKRIIQQCQGGGRAGALRFPQER